ncbi:peptidoglycan recognition protein family protein [Nocardia cyriacigeorgica]|uniref:peptidoglycan recognition protein family protein n=1 Tax=Nocardia cyriacigeorgica TaxID=135487 RepID=UPI0024572502|nr:N-acetylmuramoyl-L-alanine amidase [Nocardia cyriacigeorgica]
MAWTGDPVWLADVLRAEGLKVIEHDGWRQRGHGDFLDIRGVLCHHTAGGGPNDWRIVQNGRPDLPGPLAQLVLERDGTYRVIAAGVCWHAGRGAWPGWPTNNANYHVVGIEAVNDGRGQSWPDVQLDAYKRGCAAILRRVGLDAGRCVAHREYSTEGKIDPAGIDMAAFRRDVQALIDRKGGDMSFLDEKITNYRGDEVTVGTLLHYLDKHIGLILDQLGGPDTSRGADFPGWGILGDRTAIEMLGAIADKLGVDAEEVKR